MVQQIAVEDLKKLLDANKNLVLVDCREPDEHAYCAIAGARLIPLSQFRERALQELDPADDVYIHCHHGGRSQRACEFLEENGFEKTHNVAGGIEAWALKVDKNVKRY